MAHIFDYTKNLDGLLKIQHILSHFVIILQFYIQNS